MSVLWHCWLGDRKDIRLVKSWVLVVMIWMWSPTTPVVITTSVILSSNNIQNRDILVPAELTRVHLEKWPLNRRERDYSRLGLVPQRPPRENLWGLVSQDCLYRTDALSSYCPTPSLPRHCWVGNRMHQINITLTAWSRLLDYGSTIPTDLPVSTYYLCWGDYVFIGICLFVSRIMHKLLNRFSQYLVERWQVSHGRNR